MDLTTNCENQTRSPRFDIIFIVSHQKFDGKPAAKTTQFEALVGMDQDCFELTSTDHQYYQVIIQYLSILKSYIGQKVAAAHVGIFVGLSSNYLEHYHYIWNHHYYTFEKKREVSSTKKPPLECLVGIKSMVSSLQLYRHSKIQHGNERLLTNSQFTEKQ